MAKRYLDSIEIVLGTIALGMSTVLLALIANWGLKLTVANSSPSIAFGWFLVCGCLGMAIVLLAKYATLFKLVGKIAKTAIGIFSKP